MSVDLIKKWHVSGLLEKASEENHQMIAERLEAAMARSIASVSRKPIDDEIALLRAEGLITS